MYCECGCGEKTTIAKKNRPHLGHIKGQPVRFISGHSTRLREQDGEKNPMWTNTPSYNAIHMWIRRNLTQIGQCAKCGREGLTEWANISGEYRRTDPWDWPELCRSC